jgi:hypothetical protein
LFGINCNAKSIHERYTNEYNSVNKT